MRISKVMGISAGKIIRTAALSVMAACLGFFAFDHNVRAAGLSRDVFGTGSDYTAILYDSTNGMPTSEANAIAQSGDGFIWLGGYSGLIRYDDRPMLERFTQEVELKDIHPTHNFWDGPDIMHILLVQHVSHALSSSTRLFLFSISSTLFSIFINPSFQ